MFKKRVSILICIIILLSAFLPAAVPAMAEGSVPTVGSMRTFYVGDFDRYRTVDAVLAAVSNSALIYVDANDSLTHEFAPNGTTPHNNTAAIAKECDTMYSMFCTPGKSAYFGTPANLNGNGKVIYLLMDIENDGDNPNGSLLGFFDGSDFYKKNEFRFSNEAAMLYIDIGEVQGYSYLKNEGVKSFCSTIAHELQHLINYSYVYQTKGATSPETWLNEGLSELMSTLYYPTYRQSMLSLINYSDYLPNGYGLTPSDSQWQSAPTRSLTSCYDIAKMLLISYYQHGGNIHALVKDGEGGEKSREALAKNFFATSDYRGSSFNNFFTRFCLDMAVDTIDASVATLNSAGITPFAFKNVHVWGDRIKTAPRIKETNTLNCNNAIYSTQVLLSDGPANGGKITLSNAGGGRYYLIQAYKITGANTPEKWASAPKYAVELKEGTYNIRSDTNNMFAIVAISTSSKVNATVNVSVTK